MKVGLGKRKKAFEKTKSETKSFDENFWSYHFWSDAITDSIKCLSFDLIKQHVWERLNYKLSSQLCFVQQNWAARESWSVLIWITFNAKVLLIGLSSLFTEEFRWSLPKCDSFWILFLLLIPKGIMRTPVHCCWVVWASLRWSSLVISSSTTSSVVLVASSIVSISSTSIGCWVSLLNYFR